VGGQEFRSKGSAVAIDYGVGRSPGAYLTEKMNKIIFPTVQFQGATIDEAIEYLRVKSRDLGHLYGCTGVKGVNIILRTGDAPSNASISLDLKDVPMSEALRYITELAQMKYKVEAHAVLVVPLSENASEQYTSSYRVPPDFLSSRVEVMQVRQPLRLLLIPLQPVVVLMQVVVVEP
jgi:general secretion pathway protein D